MTERLPTPTPERRLLSEAAAIEIAGPAVREAAGVSGVEELVAKPSDNEREQWIRRYREAMATEMASKLHDDWRAGRLQEDGSYEPRVKQTKDRAWIEAHGTDEVDIANTEYSDLPSDWRAENSEAAKVIYDLVDDPATRGMVISAPEHPAPAGQQVHEAWLGRNEWAVGGELDVPFDKLSPEEQVKDTRQVDIARETFGYTSQTRDQ